MAIWTYIRIGIYVAMTAGFFIFVFAQRRRAAPDGDARCGSCGYPTRGLPTSICPECGQDLNVVGLRRPTYWNRLTPTQRRNYRLVWWTWYVAALPILAWPLLQYYQPGRRYMSDSGTLVAASGAFHVDVERAWQTRGWGYDPGQVPDPDCALTAWAVSVHGAWYKPFRGEIPAYLLDPDALRPARDEVVFVVCVRDACCGYVDPSTGGTVRRPNADWRRYLAAWLGEVKRANHHPTLSADVMTIIDTVLDRPYFTLPSGELTGLESAGDARGWAFEPDWWWLVLVIGLLVLIWFGGCAWITSHYAVPSRGG